MKKHLTFVPNLITSANLFSGCLAVVFAFKGQLEMALLLVLLASIFDFLDGYAARVLNAISPIGKELDSLSDLISFGMAPAVMLYVASENIWGYDFLKYLPFLLVVFSALRLAKFNVDTRQESDFLGIPTPANAFFFVSFANLVKDVDYAQNQVVVAAFILFFSMIMVSELKIFSIKKLTVDKTKMVFTILLFIVGAVAIVFTRFYAGVIIIPVYLLLSGVKSFITK
jgi:CDP-diacylglycerol--serine O-phosphatidyltransferase